jgi:GTPase SAR1 family protein
MFSKKDQIGQGASATRDSVIPERLQNNAIGCPGLSPGADEIHGLSRDLPKRMAVFSYKRTIPCLWVIFLGGTGTGKSTLFNAFCGRDLSETGVERPKTSGPVVYAHLGLPLKKDFPFPHIQVEILALEEDAFAPVRGRPGHLLILQHHQENRSHLAVVDTPDLDSVETENRRFAEDVYLLADVVVFVSSQEKYADEVPFQFLEKVVRESKPYYFLLNKVHEGLSREDVRGTLETQGVTLSSNRIWLLPHVPQDPSRHISEDASFLDFADHLFGDLSEGKAGPVGKEVYLRERRDLKERIERLLELLELENEETRHWTADLENLFGKATRGLAQEEKERYAAKSREFLGKEIRRLFTRYDILARPRQFVKSLLLRPFRLLRGPEGKPGQARREELLKIRQKIDLAPVQRILEKFNASVLKELSPSNQTAPLFQELRRPGLALTDEEIRTRVLERQDHLEKWLEEKFRRLSEDLPRRKKWGIYSTTILWGILILSFETVVGGGFSIIDAALDSALAPFVTKGTVELFAYHEIQKIARELAVQYHEGLASVVAVQRDRYRACLESLTTPPDTLEWIRSFYVTMSEK